MKEFFKILANMEITSFILIIIPVPFLLGAFYTAYNLVFNEVAKKQVAIENLLLLVFIAVLMYVVFGTIFRMDYNDTKRELNK
jgi:uncharacterized membrane protein YwzB